jgi:hypothetical protein
VLSEANKPIAGIFQPAFHKHGPKPEVCRHFAWEDAEKFRPWNFSARCGAVHARAALYESRAYAPHSCRDVTPRFDDTQPA